MKHDTKHPTQKLEFHKKLILAQHPPPGALTDCYPPHIADGAATVPPQGTGLQSQNKKLFNDIAIGAFRCDTEGP